MEDKIIMTPEDRKKARKKFKKKTFVKAVASVDTATEVSIYGGVVGAVYSFINISSTSGVAISLFSVLMMLIKKRLPKGPLTEYLEENETVFSKDVTQGSVTIVSLVATILFLQYGQYYAAAYSGIVFAIFAVIKYKSGKTEIVKKLEKSTQEIISDYESEYNSIIGKKTNE